MVTTEDAHKIGLDMFGPDSYTVERREFADGDTRTIVKHSRGPAHDCYLQVEVWMDFDRVVIEYIEDDIGRFETIVPLEEFDPRKDLWDYIW